MPRYVLHVGCGPSSLRRLHRMFHASDWLEVRLDIDRAVAPDITASITDMHADVRNCTYDAIWSSHNIEHLYSHEVPLAFLEFHRVLKPDGFLLVCCPDIQAVALTIAEGKIDHVAYHSPAGPITALDMVFGYGKAVENGNRYMAHHTGFTQERLANLLLDAGFVEVRTLSKSFDLWCVAAMCKTNIDLVLSDLALSGLKFS